MTQPPAILDQYFELRGDNVQNVEVDCVMCQRSTLPVIYLNTYEGTTPFANTDVQVVRTIADMLYHMWDHIAKIHPEHVR